MPTPGGCWLWIASPSTWRRGSASAWSDPTARARQRCSSVSPGSMAGAAERSAWQGSTRDARRSGANYRHLIASHDLELILETCQRCLVLDRGRVIAEGPARQLLADAALMEAHGLEVPYSLR